MNKKNERNAGRKPLYKEETKRVTIICPLSAENGLKEVAKAYLSDFKIKEQVTKSETSKPKLRKESLNLKSKNGLMEYDCGCTIDYSSPYKIFKNSPKCKLTKEEHINNK